MKGANAKDSLKIWFHLRAAELSNEYKETFIAVW